MYPKAVIFDFDGVIVDTEPIHYRSFQKLLEPLGLGYSWEEYTDRYMGFDDRDAFREVFRLRKRELDEHYLQELISLKASYFEGVVEQGVTAYPGVLKLVEELANKNVALAISSGALRSDIMPILNRLKINSYFKHIVTADDVSQSKPDPACYLMAKQLLINSFPEITNDPSLMYAIEDTPAGIQSAKGADLKVIATTNSYPPERLTRADLIVTELTQLCDGNWPK